MNFEEFKKNFNFNAEIVAEAILCPVCYELPQSRIFVCKNGHDICSECYEQLRPTAVCPLGKCEYHQPPLRNKPIEGISADIKAKRREQTQRESAATRDENKENNRGFPKESTIEKRIHLTY